ncbi:MAG: tRNA lysidine(34) synthetase TilS [Pseudomonadota bacterium]
MLTAVGVELQRSLSSIDFNGRPSVLLAVSGGSDSIGLLTAYSEFGADLPKAIVCTVDHQLRVESADEAEGVAEYCTKLGVRHVTKRWDGSNHTPGTMSAAREARYHLLSEAANEAGTDLVLVAHTLDDQRELFAMRSARNDSGGVGLAGMAPASLYDGRTWFARPFLQHRRVGIREYLLSKATSWIDDPTNDDQNYERSRVRRSFSSLDFAVVDQRMKDASAKRFQRAAAAAELICDEDFFLMRKGPVDACGRWPNCAVLNSRYHEVRCSTVDAVEYISRVFAARRYPLSQDRWQMLQTFLTGRGHAALTLGGCVFQHCHGYVNIRNDPRNFRAAAFPPITPLFDWPTYCALKLRLGDTRPSPPPIQRLK